VGGVVVRPANVRRDPTLADVTALLFAESQAKVKAAPRNVAVTSLISTSGFTAAAQGTDEKAKVYRAIASATLATRDDPIDMYNALTLANTMNMPEQACRLAVRLFESKG